jgi:protein-S-isoprenylcysteine O-methyltransferase Ste14
MSRPIQNLVVTVLLLCVSITANAYVGPGAGISVLGSLLGILATIVLAIGAILMWPVRKMLKRKKARAAEAESAVAQTDAASE